jgi:hypothetical protein
MPSNKEFTATDMVRGVLDLAFGPKFDRISLGYPGAIENGEPALNHPILARNG